MQATVGHMTTSSGEKPERENPTTITKPQMVDNSIAPLEAG
jgi:hypothetical protein